MSNNDYVIFIKKKRGDFEPVDSAETKEEGIEVAKAYLENPKVLEAEVVYMPEDDYDIEEVVWNSSKDMDENLNEEKAGAEEDSAWSEEEVRAELIKMTNNFKKNEGEITTWYEEEKEHIKNILDAAGYQIEVSDGRKDKDDDMHWVITFVKKVNESLVKNLDTEEHYILDTVERNFGTVIEPYYGPTYILPNGKLLNLSKCKHHSEVDQFLVDEGIIDGEVVVTGGSPAIEAVGCIRCDNVKYYIGLSKEQPTSEQYNSLLIWLDNHFKFTKLITVLSPDGVLSVDYSVDEDFISDDVVDRIRRYYVSGKLYEQLDTSINMKRQHNFTYCRESLGDKLKKANPSKNKVNENLTENSNMKLALELIDNDEDNMVATYKASSGKDDLSLAVETIGYTNGTNESGLKVSKEDIKKLEVVSSLSEGNDISDVFIDIDDNKDLIYCGKFNSGDYTNVDKIIKVIEDWAKGTVVEESLNEDTNINIDKVEIDVDTLNTKTKKIDEDIAFDKDKKLTIREMYDFLLKSGIANGCDIILDWDNDSDLSDPKTAIEWLDLIIETYYDLDSDLRYMNANDEAERNMDQVIVPLEDFRNELNEKGLAQLNNIYYQVISYNNDSGDDDFDDYDNYGAAETAFENWINDYKEDGVDGAVELLQVDDNKGTSKQLKYWSAEDDNAWKFDENLSDNKVIDYGCDMCGKRVPEDQIFWFYGGEIGLCEECYDKTSTYVKVRLDDGDFSFLDNEY